MPRLRRTRTERRGGEMTEYTRDDLRQELLEDSTQYCCYCGTPKGSRWHCCKEVHFETFAEMDEAQQEQILEETWQGAR